MKLETAKGMKDFLPEEEITRQAIIAQLRETFELYGFSPLDTPGVERLDILTAKYAGGEEILRRFSGLATREGGISGSGTT